MQNVAPKVFREAGYRVVRTMPVLFSPINPRKLYFSSNVVWQTLNGGQSWEQISPDLTRPTWEVPKNVGKYIGTDAARVTQRGVVYTIAPSPRDENVIWAGTDDGLIQITRDAGKSWQNVTPPALGPWFKVSLMDASHFDTGTAYAAINTLRLDDLRPHIFRTRDYGATWTHITSGIPEAVSPTSFVRTPNVVVCCSQGRSRPCSSRLTMAITGSRCGGTCRRRRFAIS